ncbi:hypothetical protein PAESOLCIP111_02622 [Paenibacillus solanacearum]|uniref:Uncharacterized protein n=2 Tax=Paenibacillus solanacearum TaxID=2048548 RepID=A0A916NIS2_9BACL|nr:hypothetical protein PAESOLCIP111_02622 [Paenibacillus solanacearum]
MGRRLLRDKFSSSCRASEEGRGTMKKIMLCGVTAVWLLIAGTGCQSAALLPPEGSEAPSAGKRAQADRAYGDLLVADDHRVFSVDSKAQRAQEVLHTEQPISSVCYTKDHAVVTVFEPDNPNGFRGLYVHDNNKDGYDQVATPAMAPRLSYVNGDLAFLASAEVTPQPDGDYTKVGIYQLKQRQWVKEWMMPGGVEDVRGSGNTVWIVTSNNASTSSNVSKLDLATGQWDKLIQQPRRYPLDEAEVDTNGELYLMISQRHKNEWSNKIFRFNPQQNPYELTGNFVSNTRPYSFAIRALNGKMLIARHDATGSNPELEKPLSLLDLKSRKQVHLAWDHQPVALERTESEFVALAEDGALAFIGTEATEKPDRTVVIEGLEAGRWISVKR